jgi:leucyl aminopeptidase
LTVEIANTDSEGRLVLIDTFTYVQEKYKPKKIIDLATLTLTTTIALGTLANGLFTNEEEFAEEYKKRGEEMHEQSWILPIFEEHKQEITGTVSDLVNRGMDTKGHSSRAAAFMLNFIDEGTAWIHVDFYGPAHLKKAYPPMPLYGTGFNTQTILNLLRKQK